MCLSALPTSSPNVALRCMLPHSRNNTGDPLRSSSIPDCTRGIVTDMLGVGFNGSLSAPKGSFSNTGVR